MAYHSHLSRHVLTVIALIPPTPTMSFGERQTGIQVHRPIIYGSHARLLTDEEKISAPPGRECSPVPPPCLFMLRQTSKDTHRWTIFLASATSAPPLKPFSPTDPVDIDYLPGGNDDLGSFLKRVTFRLHETYTNPARGDCHA